MDLVAKLKIILKFPKLYFYKSEKSDLIRRIYSWLHKVQD